MTSSPGAIRRIRQPWHGKYRENCPPHLRAKTLCRRCMRAVRRGTSIVLMKIKRPHMLAVSNVLHSTRMELRLMQL